MLPSSWFAKLRFQRRVKRNDTRSAYDGLVRADEGTRRRTRSSSSSSSSHAGPTRSRQAGRMGGRHAPHGRRTSRPVKTPSTALLPYVLTAAGGHPNDGEVVCVLYTRMCCLLPLRQTALYTPGASEAAIVKAFTEWKAKHATALMPDEFVIPMNNYVKARLKHSSTAAAVHAFLSSKNLRYEGYMVAHRAEAPVTRGGGGGDGGGTTTITTDASTTTTTGPTGASGQQQQQPPPPSSPSNAAGAAGMVAAHLPKVSIHLIYALATPLPVQGMTVDPNLITLMHSTKDDTSRITFGVQDLERALPAPVADCVPGLTVKLQSPLEELKTRPFLVVAEYALIEGLV